MENNEKLNKPCSNIYYIPKGRADISKSWPFPKSTMLEAATKPNNSLPSKTTEHIKYNNHYNCDYKFIPKFLLCWTITNNL